MNLMPGDRAVFRYIYNENTFSRMEIRAEGSGKIGVFLNGRSARILEIREGGQRTDRIMSSPGKYELELRVIEADGLEIDWIRFR